jgi:hypothetical protein
MSCVIVINLATVRKFKVMSNDFKLLWKYAVDIGEHTNESEEIGHKWIKKLKHVIFET